VLRVVRIRVEPGLASTHAFFSGSVGTDPLARYQEKCDPDSTLTVDW
jgi:hypothetical protein